MPRPLQRPELIVLHLSRSEKDEIERMARIYGMPTAVYARVAVLGYIDDDKRGMKIPPEVSDDAER